MTKRCMNLHALSVARERERERERERGRGRGRGRGERERGEGRGRGRGGGGEREREIYIYAVKLKTGPIFALFKVKNWSNFFVFLDFYFQKSHSPCRKKRIFEKQAKKTTKNTISKVKNWSNYVAQHTWTSF